MSEQTEIEEWVEIVEPSTSKIIFANLANGECLWAVPPGTAVRRATENQWWELFDSSSKKFYYYNPSTAATVWQKPNNVEIIPLAKLQHLKEHTETALSNNLNCPRYDKNCAVSNSSLDDGVYSNFSRDLTTNLEDNVSNPTTASSSTYPNIHSETMRLDGRKKRTSACSNHSHNSSTKSKFDNCLQELVFSQSVFSEGNNGGSRSSSSLSSFGRSDDIQISNVSAAIDSERGSAPKSKPIISDSKNSWTKDPLKSALTNTTDKKFKKLAVQTFKCIQSYQGDRKSKTSADSLALRLLESCSDNIPLIDEVFMQMIKQLTDNPKAESLRKGWELLGVFLFFFIPTDPDVQNAVLKFVESSSDPLLDCPEFSTSRHAKHCLKRLQLPINALRPSILSIQQARYNIFYPSMFGTSLEELMDLQADKYPNLRVPWIESTLIAMILEQGGENTEGVFRIAPDQEQLHMGIVQLNVWVRPVVKDAHMPAALLKKWLRQLPSPLITEELYDRCLMVSTDADECCRIIGQLPSLNRMVMSALVVLLQRLCAEETVRITKMDVSNLAMVFAPNVLRCQSTDPAVIFANSQKEMEFMKTVILHYSLN